MALPVGTTRTLTCWNSGATCRGLLSLLRPTHLMFRTWLRPSFTAPEDDWPTGQFLFGELSCPMVNSQSPLPGTPSFLQPHRRKGGIPQTWTHPSQYNSLSMPRNLVRYQKCGVFHFITFSCYQRRPLLNSVSAYRVFERELEAVRRRYGFVVAGYVLMPEHVHLLVGEPRVASLSTAIQVLKQQTSRKLKAQGETQFWQRRYYDFNVHNEDKRVEKLKYMHRNPVKRGLVTKPEQWPWSSFLHYATGKEGTVEIESEWTARRREEALRGESEQTRSPTLAR